jgi:putative ABC transport system ATP-binding protein
MTLFKELNERDGLTIVVVTHEIDLANYADRHVVFSDGRVVADDAVTADTPGAEVYAP